MILRETIPITVEPEAAARIAELGFQEQVDRMIDHAMQTLPQINQIEIVMNYRYDEDSPDGVSVDVWSDCPFSPGNDDSLELSYQMVRMFPPEVLMHLSMGYYEGTGHAG